MDINANDYYVIDINLDEGPTSVYDMIGEITMLKPSSKKKVSINEDEEPMEDSSIIFSKPKKEKNKKKKDKKKNKRSIMDEGSDFDITDIDDDDDETDEVLLDIDEIVREREEYEIDEDIIGEQKRGYKKLKKQENEYKKEFAEELTLLYNLLDETGKFGKDLEKELKSLKSSRSRGVSKYTNDLAELVLSSKQNKLNILKEISSIKKTIADLKIKADGKDKNKGDDNSPEKLASAYFKNILSGGRTNFINNFTGADEENNEYDDMIDRIETLKDTGTFMSDNDLQESYERRLEERLSGGNPYRSEAGSKYIEYENAGVKVSIKRCIDTGEWEFVAIDKFNRQINDYPLPTKRGAGKMRFSSDGAYATDEKGIMYNVIEYYLPDEE